ncbi:MAG: acetylxylan esterase [Clostridia bacterium]|nr:acetylxylan esterase [Clostridia bacterium]MBQ7101010.1 acetylxylan esterase [Clostridia bacterium]
MKSSPYSPDGFMKTLYESTYTNPFENVNTKEDASAVCESIRAQAKSIFCIDKIPDRVTELKPIPVGKPLIYKYYTLQKYSVEICTGLNMAYFMLTPVNVKADAPGVVALCGHGYGVRQILGINKKGGKKLIPYLDDYQKSFAVELVKRGCVVIAPELIGFGEARLKKDLIKPFYISSCDELSHHLLPYGLTVATMRVYQAVVCARLLEENENTDADKISCMGISGGGLTALYASVTDQAFKKTVISGYINTFRDSILSLWHCPDNYIPDIIRTGEIYDFACTLAPRKLLIESGTRDKLFPINASRQAHESIKIIYALLGAQDNIVIDVFDGKHSVSGRKAFDFLSEY